MHAHFNYAKFAYIFLKRSLVDLLLPWVKVDLLPERISMKTARRRR